MKTYSIPVISQYFTSESFGVALLRDEGTVAHDDLEWYFNDLYQLFLYQFARLVHESSFTPHEEQKMQHMLIELMKVKRMLAGSIEPI